MSLWLMSHWKDLYILNLQSELTRTILCFLFSGAYFQNIFTDYQAVAMETMSDIREHPIKATIYISGLVVTGFLLRTNPSEESFYENVTENQNTIVTVGDAIRNPYSNAHIENLRTCINEGVLRRTSFGICSFMWVDNFDSNVDLFVAHCKPLKVGWLEWKERIIDFGISNRWWWMYKAMKDYDINPDEWKETMPSINIIAEK